MTCTKSFIKYANLVNSALSISHQRYERRYTKKNTFTFVEYVLKQNKLRMYNIGEITKIVT